MSKVIRFLEATGSSAKLSTDDYAAAVAVLQVNADQKQALLDRDHLALTTLLDGRAEMCCHISVPGGVDVGLERMIALTGRASEALEPVAMLVSQAFP